jgi:hypothetical protein
MLSGILKLKKYNKMRLFVILTMILFCGTAKAQKSALSNLCPPGTVPHYYWAVDVINFHKPKTDCKSKFGFCFRATQGMECVPSQNWQQYKLGISNGIVTAWSIVQNNQLELHIPLALKDTDGFRLEDMTEFTIDDDTIKLADSNGNVVTSLKGGTYPVKIIEGQYVIQIPLK